MAGPIIFISHFLVREGTLDAYMTLHRQVAAQLHADKPRTLAFLAYADGGQARISIVHAFEDAESMDVHVEGAGERSQAAYEYLVPDGWEVYGTPSEPVLRMLGDAAASSGVRLTVTPAYLTGFLRLGSGT